MTANTGRVAGGRVSAGAAMRLRRRVPPARSAWGRARAVDLALFALVAVLTLALGVLAWRALGAGQGLREAFAEHNEVLGTMGDLKFRIAGMRARELQYTLEAQGQPAQADQVPSRAVFLRETDALGQRLNELLAARLSREERAALEELHAGLAAFLKADGQLAGALRNPSAEERQRQSADALAAGGRAVDAMSATIDRLTEAELKQDAARSDSLYAHARQLRFLVTAAALCGALLAAVLLLSWAAAMRRNASMSSRIEQFALTDEGTGLPNHRAWSERLTAEIARAIRQASTLSLVLMDVDLAAASTGAAARGGDQRAVARAWKSALRRDDYVARLSATQFGLILPACDAAQAATMAERLRALASLTQRFAAGIADWDRRETAEHLMARVESALQHAKTQGASPSVVLAAGREAQTSDEDRLLGR